MKNKQSYEEFQKVLGESLSWPNVYIFKFILPDDPLKLSRLHSILGEHAKVSYKSSGKGNYISLTCKEVMINPESVVNIYKQAAKIEGVIIL